VAILSPKNVRYEFRDPERCDQSSGYLKIFKNNLNEC
jgi:hypothetical protein